MKLASETDETQRVVGCLVLVALLTWVVVLNLQAFRGQRAVHWPETTGVVTRVEVIPHLHQNDHPVKWSWEVEVGYRYSVAGREYQSDRIGIGTKWIFDHESDARALVAKLQSEPRVVYFDPDDPGEAVLVRGVGGGMAVTLFLALVGFGVLSGATTFFHLRIGLRRAVGKKAAPARPPLRLAIAVGVGAGLFCIVLQSLVYARWLS